VGEHCFQDPAEFHAIPQMAAIGSWRGRNVAELVASWGEPQAIESTGGKTYRYVWVASRTVPGEVSYQNDQWTTEWDLVRSPDQNYQCKTYMRIEADQTVTPLWVDRLGVCTDYFKPRPYAPPRAVVVPVDTPPARRAAPGAAPVAVPVEQESPVPLEPPRQIREQENM
jgi:hypothetical protein